MSLAASGFIGYEDTTCVPSLFKSVRGKVLELGPGPGNQLQRYDPDLVDFIYAVEPNEYYRDNLATKVKKLDLENKYKLLACGVEDRGLLKREGITEASMDTIHSIQVLCSVGNVEKVMQEVWRLLKPGGNFVFWEHVRSKDMITATTQGA